MENYLEIHRKATKLQLFGYEVEAEQTKIIIKKVSVKNNQCFQSNEAYQHNPCFAIENLFYFL